MALIGLLGGTFDPIHNTHISMGIAVKKQMNLDKVIYIPTGNPPHKSSVKTSAEHRLNMVRLAIKDIDFFEASDYEVNKKTYSYSVETLTHFKNENPKDEYVFIVGEDSLDYIDKWYKPEVLLKLCRFAVVGRGGFKSDIPKKIESLKEKYGAEIELVKMSKKNISSSMIRGLIGENKDVSDLIDGSVLKYIKDNALYAQSL